MKVKKHAKTIEVTSISLILVCTCILGLLVGGFCSIDTYGSIPSDEYIKNVTNTNTIDLNAPVVRQSASGEKELLIEVATAEWKKFIGGQLRSGSIYYNSIGGTQTSWACSFVYWCLNEAGSIGSGCTFGTTLYNKSYESWKSLDGLGVSKSIVYGGASDYVPQAGDLVYFSNGSDESSICHIAIVDSVVGDNIHIIEGSIKDAEGNYVVNGRDLKQNPYNNIEVYGYAHPSYKNSDGTTGNGGDFGAPVSGTWKMNTTAFADTIAHYEEANGVTKSCGAANRMYNVYSFFRVKMGMSRFVAIAMMSTLFGENPAYYPGTEEGGKSIGFGLMQWSYGRREAVENFCASLGKPRNDLESQLLYLETEMTSNASYKRCIDYVRNIEEIGGTAGSVLSDSTKCDRWGNKFQGTGWSGMYLAVATLVIGIETPAHTDAGARNRGEWGANALNGVDELVKFGVYAHRSEGNLFKEMEEQLQKDYGTGKSNGDTGSAGTGITLDKTVLIIGDSNTVRTYQNVPEIKKAIVCAQIGVGLNSYKTGVSGQKVVGDYAGSSTLEVAVNKAFDEHKDIKTVVVMLGTNDFSSSIRNSYSTFVNMIYSKNPSVTLNVCTVFPVFGDTYNVNNPINANKDIESVYNEYKGLGKSIYYVDVYSGMAGADGKMKTEYRPSAGDGLHSNGEGCKKFLDTVVNNGHQG